VRVQWCLCLVAGALGTSLALSLSMPHPPDLRALATRIPTSYVYVSLCRLSDQFVCHGIAARVAYRVAPARVFPVWLWAILRTG